MDRMVKQYGHPVKFLQSVDLANDKLFNPNNLIFTVCDELGAPLGFAARKLNYEADTEAFLARAIAIKANGGLTDEQKAAAIEENLKTKVAKYTNTSAHNPFYQKIRRLFGFHIAKKACPPLFIMEGYPDCATAQDRGMRNVCAIGATAFTKEHVDVILDCGIKHLIFVLDGDSEGYKATDRAIKVIEEAVGDRIGLKVELIQMPEGTDDPDRYIRLYGVDEFQKLPRLDIFSWKVKRQMQAGSDPIMLANEAVPLIVNEPNYLLRLAQIQKLAHVTGVDEEWLRSEVLRRVDQNDGKAREEMALITTRMISDIKRSPDSVMETMRQTMAQIEVIQKGKDGYNPQNVLSAYTYVFDKQSAHVTDIEIRTGFPIYDKKLGGLPKGAAFISVPGKPNQGKGLVMSAKLKTPTGWMLNGDVQVGDVLASVDGQPNFVTGVFPQGLKKTYRVTFSDGRSVVTDGDHLWETHFIHQYSEGFADTKHNGWHVFNTEAIREFCLNGNRKNSHRTLFVPMVNGEFGSHEPLPLDPWLVGVLLGDGALGSGSIGLASADDELIDAVQVLLEPMNLSAKVNGKGRNGKKPVDFRLCGEQKGCSNPLIDGLKEIGLRGHGAETKFIPAMYLNSDRPSRLSLLRGLLDTDGTAGKDRTIQFCTVSPQLALDVTELVRSLGGICKSSRPKNSYYNYNGRRMQGKDAYILGIRMANRHEVFTLARKLAKVPEADNRVPRLTITDIQEEGVQETQCIMVSHPSHLYITDDYIVTHNTSLLSNLAWRIPDNNPDTITIFHTVDDALDKAIPRILGSKYHLPSKLWRKKGYYTGSHAGREEVAEKWPHFPEIYAESQAWLQHQINEERLIIADINLLAGSLPALEGWLKSIRKRFPNDAIVCMGDNFALYQLDVASDSEAVRARQKSQFVKRMGNAYQTCMLMTAELTKESLKPGIRPRLGGHLKSGHMRSLQNRPYGLA
jgi:hypothetical protein